MHNGICKITERIMELAEYEEKHVRVTDTDGETYTGIAEYFPAEYSLHEYGRLIPLRKRKCTEQRSSGRNG